MESLAARLVRWNPKSVRYAIEKSEQSGDVDRFRDLWLCPTVLSQGLNVLSGGAICGFSDFGNIAEQCALGRTELSFIQCPSGDCRGRFVVCPLFTQGVRMRFQSIWAAIEVRDPGRDRLLDSPVQVPMRKVDAVTHTNHIPKEVGPVAKAFQNSRHLLFAGNR